MKEKMEFIHLHTHSHYSLLDGLSKLEDLVDLAKGFKMPAMAITDNGNMYGAIEFYKLARKAGIKPIIGVEAYVANRSRLDKDPGIDNKRYHLTLLAKNLQGYKNLMRLVTISHLEGFYYKPRRDHCALRLPGRRAGAGAAKQKRRTSRTSDSGTSGNLRTGKLFSGNPKTLQRAGFGRGARRYHQAQPEVECVARGHHRFTLSAQGISSSARDTVGYPNELRH